MRIATASLFAAALATAALSGCNTDPPAAKPDKVSAAAYPQITATEGLDRFVAYDKAVVDRSDAGAMSVSVPVRLTRNKETPIEYRFTFFDERGRPLRPESDWQYKVLPARTQQFISSTALDMDATDWRLEIRPAR